jgi:hypothetical protein
MRHRHRRVGHRAIVTVCVATLGLAACGGPGAPKQTERPLTIDEATLLASVQYDNYQDRGAAFQVATAFIVTGDTLNLQGVVDWERHVGYAIATAKGAESGITELYWTDNVVLERRPAADPILQSMGYTSVKYFARPPDATKRLLDRALAIVLSLASTERDNPQLIQQKEGSAFLRPDTLRDTTTNVFRYGLRTIYWLDNTGVMVRFEGNATGGGAPTVVDILTRGAQTITLPKDDEVVDVSTMQELYDALSRGDVTTPTAGRTGS